MVLVVAASLVALRKDDTGDDVKAGDATEIDQPDALVPTRPPEGMELWSLSSSVGSDPVSVAGRYQLFGDPGSGPAMLVTFLPPGGGGPPGEPALVRGQFAALYAPVDELEAEKSVSWSEGDASVSAHFTGMTKVEGLAFLEEIALRSDSVQDGFEPPSTGPLQLTEEIVQPVQQPRAVVGLVYGDRLPAGAEGGRRVVVETKSATGQPDWQYMQARIGGSTDADGVVTFVDEQSRTTLFWPDGRQVTISTTGEAVDSADIDRMVDSVEPVTDADLARLRDDADRWAAGAPLVASSDLPSATVELRGVGDFLLVCLRLPGSAGAIHCGIHPALWTGGTSDVAVSLVLDGEWYVAAVANSAQPPSLVSSDGAHPLPASESATTDGWSFALVHVSDGVPGVEAGFPSGSLGWGRPTELDP